MSETSIVKLIQLALAKIGVRLFRNNIGMFTDDFGNKVRYGLAPGTSDLIGWRSFMITSEMVGRRIAVFVAVEVKKPGARTDKERLELQLNFIRVVNEAGGIAFIAQSVEEAERLIKL